MASKKHVKEVYVRVPLIRDAVEAAAERVVEHQITYGYDDTHVFPMGMSTYNRVTGSSWVVARV